MAGQMTHMVIAYDLIKRLGIKEGKAEFVLGCVEINKFDPKNA